MKVQSRFLLQLSASFQVIGLLLLLMILTGCSKDSHSEKVDIIVKNSKFSIPKGYIWHKPAWIGGKMDGVNMHALLPDMAYRNEDNKSEFDGGGDHRNNVVGILLSKINKPVSSDEGSDWKTNRQRESFNWKIKAFMQGNAVDGPFGFKMYRGVKTAFRDELLFRTMPDGALFFIECSSDLKVPSPGCSITYYYSDKLYVRYSYRKPHLKDWQEIDRKVRQLIQSFSIKQSV